MHEQYSNPSRQQQQRQFAVLKRQKQQQQDQDSHRRPPMPLTKSVPFLTSQPEMSWLKAVAPENMEYCGSRRSCAILFFMIGVVAILDKEKNGVRLLVCC